ncbi:MAG TPA: PQQ-dependent sugar dehydrogenase [Planctomycetota bacterium]
MSAQTVPTGFVVDTVVPSGLNAPLDFCFLPDGRVLIANRAGVVSVYAGGSAVTVGTVPSVESGGERGLLSICSDPSFPSNGYIYVYYSSTADSFMHLDRFTCTGDLANPSSTNLTFAASSRRVILGAIPDNAFNHNGGSCRFGPDGKLYQSIGDDAGACNAQSNTSSLGCLMRMDVSTLPAGGSTTAPTFSSLDPGDNPLSSATDISQLLIAIGLRNPVRMEIDMATGSLYIGDVGQNAVEEYSEYVYPTSGPLQLVNFGWPWREGNQAYSTCGGTMPAGLVPPIAQVLQSGSGWVSVFGGARYRNQSGPYDFGPAYEGNAFYYDWFAGELRRLVNSGGTWSAAPSVPGQPSATNWGVGFSGVGALRQGPDGGLWFCHNTSTAPSSGGTLKRIRPLGPTNSVQAISGGGQVVPAGLEAFPAPLVARVLNPQGNPLPGGSVNFSVTGPATLSTTNPVIADSNGYAQTNATTTNFGGAITVTASTPGSQTNGTFSLFSRKITATAAGSPPNLLVLSITNTTTAVPPNVPYVMMVSFPGGTPLPTAVGNLCTNPLYALTVVLEDGIGIFNFVSFSGTGGTGNPSMTKLYPLPPGLLTGFLMSFQAVGFDPVTGWFRTNCEQRQF